MASHRRHRRGQHHEEEHENEERWLVSYADMMTLLFCLFMVLFAISSVNTSKFQALSKALQNAFSGAILSGGKNVMQSGSQTQGPTPAAEPPLPTITPITQAASSSQASGQESPAEKAALKEQQSFEALKRRIDALVREQGVAANVKTSIRRDGLIIELLTDGVFFDSGSALLKPAASRLLAKVGHVVASEHEHPVVVEGHTDSQPIRTAQYPSNWQLSGARAAAVIQNLAADGVLERRLSLSGYASERPADTNSTPQGRARNRRVDIVLTRLHPSATTAGRRP
jgi:chemotaxis protein MotB